jgi:hypothetical protein
MSTISISEFYTHDQLTEKLDRLVESAPDLLSLSSIGTSPQGRELWCVEAANASAGPPVESRPALLVTANMHAREVAGSWVSLHLLDHLVTEYGDDPAVTELLDERALYVVPRVAPDGADYVLDKRTWNVRSRHVELAGRDATDPDVVHMRDVDGDGRIRTMRWRAADGDEKLLEDSDEELLVSRSPEDTDGEFYRSTVEGVVPEYDGGPVREPDTRSDFNRNFPSKAWKPFDWIGHGGYPLSEPETRALAEFVIDHPNVTGVVDLHTGNPAVFYPWEVNRDDCPEADANLVERIGRRAEELTGFPYIGSYGEARGEERTVALPGSFRDFAFERHGVPAYVLELGMFYNYLGMDTEDLGDEDHERETNRRLIEYHRENPDYGLFHEWESHDHPQLGEVEIGGWDPVLWCNPPMDELPDVAADVTSFVLEFSEWAPDLSASLDAEAVGENLYRVRADLENGGPLPTNLTERGRETHSRAEPVVELTADADAEFVTGRSRRRVDHVDARGGRESLEWVVRAPAGTRLALTASTPRGAYAGAALELDS